MNFQRKNLKKKIYKLKEYLNILEKELTIKDYLVGNRLTLADIILFRFLRFFMMFHFPEKMRNNIIPNITKWFKNIMETNEAIKAYGRTILYTLPLKPFIQKINENKSPNITDNFAEKNFF